SSRFSFFTALAPTGSYTLSLHDALPISMEIVSAEEAQAMFPPMSTEGVLGAAFIPDDGYLDPSQLTFALADGEREGQLRGVEVRSEEHTSELQSRSDLVCRLLLEKKKQE